MLFVHKSIGLVIMSDRNVNGTLTMVKNMEQMSGYLLSGGHMIFNYI